MYSSMDITIDAAVIDVQPVRHWEKGEKAFAVQHLVVTTKDGVRKEFTALARTRLDAQLDALDSLAESPRFCSAHAIGRAA